KTSRWVYGIVVQKYPQQTFGFPDYKASRHVIGALYARFDVFDYLALLLTTPWEDMWENRIKVLVLFPREMFEEEFYAALPRILNVMYKWRREYWITISADMDVRNDHRYQQLSKAHRLLITSMYNDRKTRASGFMKAKYDLMSSLVLF
ncbi:hypothetical protein PHMEG_00016169, partial [Phytophthora megakarya]